MNDAMHVLGSIVVASRVKHRAVDELDLQEACRKFAYVSDGASIWTAKILVASGPSRSFGPVAAQRPPRWSILIID